MVILSDVMEKINRISYKAAYRTLKPIDNRYSGKKPDRKSGK
jgi:hypothetical protein